MLLLIVLAFVSGVATALSPCALPVLPVVFAAGSTGGRRRPLGIALGLAASFTVSVVLLVYVISALGLPDSLIRTLAIVVLIGFGATLAWPRGAHAVEAFLSSISAGLAGRILGRVRSGETERDGFASGLLVGAGLGFVYAPCAGPILAGVITTTASQPLSAQRLVVAAAYGLGSASAFLALMLGGRRLITPLARRSGRLQAAMGVVMVLVGVAMFANLDTRFQTAIASSLPQTLVNPSNALEQDADVRERLGTGSSSSRTSGLEDVGAAPELVGNERWFNTAGGRPLTIRGQRGKVVLIDFWTYTCINCIRTLPHLEETWQRYRDRGFVLIGVHSPEFAFERSAGNVAAAIRQNGLTYPVAQDNRYRTWEAFDNEYWPAQYLIDANGRIRYTHVGEGGERELERAIDALLGEAGRSAPRGEPATTVGLAGSPPDYETTPESYLGSDRAARFANGTITPGVREYRARSRLVADELAYTGSWSVDGESAAARTGASLRLRFRGRRVFLVLAPPPGGGSGAVRVLLGGRPVRAASAGRDVRSGVVTVDRQRLYELVDLRRPGSGELELRFADGVRGYAFTFG